tara:strand:- start:2176 stop:2316 length:141 start_codon:yes stop_codon:yes gene_type:complete
MTKRIEIILLILFLTSCAQFPIQDKMNQLNCEPAESDGCAGWLPKE